MKPFFAAFARNIVFANIILLLIFMAGGLASVNMIREFFPEFSLDKITIAVPYPGADPLEVEEGICRKIEDALESIEGIKEYTTVADENIGTAVIEVQEDFDVDDVLDLVRSGIDAVATFPKDAEKPIITRLTSRESVTMLTLSAVEMDEHVVKEWAGRVKDEIGQLPGVSKVSMFGLRDYEISIEISEVQLREYGLTLMQAVDAIQRNSLNLAGGTLRTKGEEIRIRTMGRRYTGEELASIAIIARPGGEIVTLGQIARIDDGFTEDPLRAMINGKPSVMIVVYKTKNEDALSISAAVHQYVKQKKRTLPPGSDIEILYDNTEMLQARINLLLKNGVIGLTLVFLILWMFLNARLSFWSGMGIPVSLAGALALFWAAGGTINMISLFALIMVLGIVVDDAIVVGEAIFVHQSMGKPPLTAAVDGIWEVGPPVTAAVLTTIVAFTPLLFISGTMGKIITVMPALVIACLAVSLVECLFILPAHLSHFHGSSGNSKPLISGIERIHRWTSKGLERFVARVYAPFLKKTIYWRYITLCVAISVLFLTIGLVRGGIVKYTFFPEIDGFIITSTLEFPNGTPAEITQEALDHIEESLLRVADRTSTASGEPLIEDRLAILGQTFGGDSQSGPHVGIVQAVLLDSESRGVHYKTIKAAWEKEVGTIAGVKSLTFKGISPGPSGAPIEIHLRGHYLDDILSAADELTAYLRRFEGVFQVESDFTPEKNEIRLTLKPEARTLGLSLDDLATQVYAAYYGLEADRIQRGRDDIRIRVRYAEAQREKLSDFKKMIIRAPNGSEVPLMSVAKTTFGPGQSRITRTDGMRRVSITADVNTDIANTKEIMEKFSAEFLPELNAEYPGLEIRSEGEKKRTQEALDSLKIGFPLALLGIYIIIATMFRSYVQPFIILFAIPFGVIGGITGHLLMGYDLSIMSLFGMVALTGVVVNDAIVLIERINENIAEGMTFTDAVGQGGVRRFRAIVLTSISTIGGLAPMIMETDFQARFLIPMALSIAGGVAFATVLTLILIPSLMVILNDIRRFIHRIDYKIWPAPEDVEPARTRHLGRYQEKAASRLSET